MTRRLTLALLFSLLLHLSLLVAPGWYLPVSDEDLSSESPTFLEAHLAAEPLHKISAPPVRPLPRMRKLRQSPAAIAAPPEISTAAAAIELPPALPEIPPSVAAPVALDAPAATPADAPGVPQASALPRQGRIRFAITRGDAGFVIGQSQHRWSHDGKRYTLSNVTETTGIAALFKPARVTQASEGEIGATGLRPIRFSTEKNGVAGDSANFDWTGMKLTLSAGSQREVPLVNGAQDLLSMFYQLSAVFPWSLREIDAIMVATGRKFERYNFQVLREELLVTKQGAMRTLHLHSAAGVEAIDIWSALDLYGLPLQIRYTDRQGDVFDQLAEDIELDGKPVAAGNR